MAVEFLDGFAHYVTSNIHQKWTFPGGTITASPPAGRLGPGLDLTAGNGVVAVTLSHQSSWIVGFAFYPTGASFSGRLYAASHAGAVELIDVRIQSDATMSIFTNNGNTLIQNSTPFSIHDNTWYYCEVKYTLQGGSGTNITCTATLKVDGTVRAQGTGTCGFDTTILLLNTPTVNSHAFENEVSGGDTYIKDLYIFDTLSGNTNNFAGDCTFILSTTTADITTEWTPTGGGSSWNQVNEVPPDDDTTYIEDGNINDLDNFFWTPVPSTLGTIVAVQYLGYIRKTAEGSRSVKLSCGAGPTQFSDEFFLNDNYVYYRMPLGTDPDTGVAWTTASFNIKPFGIKVIS